MSLAKDKQKHLIVSIIGAIIIGLIYNPLAGISCMFMIGVAYEFYQKFWGKGVFDLKDILWDLIGSAIGGGIVYLYQLIF